MADERRRALQYLADQIDRVAQAALHGSTVAEARDSTPANV
jgi:hypothetical protein